ncbi:hypothetical protein PHYSODRAFT_451202, partial [Phytophthora sojae]
SLLTTHGLRQLWQDSADGATVRVQVLGVYRYLADPALKDRLGQQFEGARDVFDVLLSDGRHKMKAVLDPKLNQLVWTRELAAHSFVSLQFLSTQHPREVELLPLAGERAYYLPLRSDHYTLDWACSFTGGVPDEDSPLDELESDWARRYGGPEGSDGSNDGQETGPSSVVAWNINPEYCSDLFTPECKKIHTILEVLDQIKKNSEPGATRKALPPMIGAIRVKSKVMNMGDPDVANPFPFAFNAVVG